MRNRIAVDPTRTLAAIDRNIFGGFAEHLGRCVYRGIYEPESPHADEQGFRTDVLDALRRLKMPLVRYPGGNFVSGYRWQDGVGPREERPARMDLAWHVIEPNTFGSNEFIEFCHKLDTEPYFVVNCGDGSMREARDWVEYCNGTQDTTLVRLRRQHGYAAPHNVRYWGVGNEVDGPWQIGYKTPDEYARALTEYAKVMKWTDPSIRIVANGVTHWEARDFVERGRAILEQAGDLIDYIALHWYVDNDSGDFATYMTLSELFEDRLSAYEGLMRAVMFERGITRPIGIAVDEWNVWHRADLDSAEHDGVIYTLEDALVVAMHLNAFIRHARTVRMASIAQIVNVLAPVYTRPDDLFLQTIFYPFELFSTLAGPTALDIHWDGATFSAGEHTGLRVLDVSATLDEGRRELVLFVVNRSETDAAETTIQLTNARATGEATMHIVNGPDIKTRNGFGTSEAVATRTRHLPISGSTFELAFEPHSVTALVCPLG